MLLAAILKRVVKTGSLELVDHAGRVHRFGDEAGPPEATVRFRTARAEHRLALRPGLAPGELYMDGEMTVDGGDIYPLLDVLTRNLGPHGTIPFHGLFQSLGFIGRFWHMYNPLGLAARNVRHHYDLSSALYDTFLDADRQYSCAYFPSPQVGLEEAQLLKKRHIAAKLLLEPGQRVLDIGCGWGGLALYLARIAKVEVVGVTLSREQHAMAVERARAAGLSDRVHFELRDYREVHERFDRIVSVGMFEHVGVPHYREYFRTVSGLLNDDGVALIHTIGRVEGPGATNPWLRRYIFPGGYTPALSEVTPAIERAKLWTTDVEVLRLHYAETLRHWRARFRARWDEVAAMYDERFCRMWDFYLAGCEVSFRNSGQQVFQFQLAKQVGTVPLTRDYVQVAEARLAHLEEALGDRVGTEAQPAAKDRRRRLQEVNNG